MGVKVEDLMQRMRAHAREHASANGSPAAIDNIDAVLARLQANVAAARRVQAQLPPVTSYRRGFAARIELWLKRRLKRATHWFTFEQVNFNAATVSALESLVATIARIDNALRELSAPANSDAQHQLVELQSEIAELSQVFQALLRNLQELQIEQRELADEQRVCFRQLSHQVTELATVADRAKRNLQRQLDEMNQRLDEISRADRID